MSVRLLERRRGRTSDRDRHVLACADVLGAFGVGPEDVARTDRFESASLEAELSRALRDARDRTAFLRQTITRSSRGLTCSGRYPDATLVAELTDVLDSIGWSIEWTPGRDGFTLVATDRTGASRETTVEYPETPLETDNLPAALDALNRDLFDGIEARFVLLSSGVDRWRAALIETDELERLSEAYGERIEAFDRPLLPTYDICTYRSTVGDEPWPEWASERAPSTAKGPRHTGGDRGDSSLDDSTRSDPIEFIEEAETDSSAPTDGDTTGPSDSTLSTDVLEVVGGAPSVTRVSDTERAGGKDSPGESADASRRTTHHFDRSVSTRRHERQERDDGFGTLSGSVQTTRVSNESFGSGVEPDTEDDRYRALGAALGSGRDISVKGLLDDEEFLPELPAAEPEEVRLTFEESFDPAAVPKAKAAAEQSGFEWVDTGSVQTTRVSNR